VLFTTYEGLRSELFPDVKDARSFARAAMTKIIDGLKGAPRKVLGTSATWIVRKKYVVEAAFSVTGDLSDQERMAAVLRVVQDLSSHKPEVLAVAFCYEAMAQFEIEGEAGKSVAQNGMAVVNAEWSGCQPAMEQAMLYRDRSGMIERVVYETGQSWTPCPGNAAMQLMKGF
jgi:hypothetical protein